MSEDDFQNAITDLASARGWLWYHTHNSMHSQKGFPDLVLVRRARVVYIEVKGPRGVVSPEQEIWIAALRGAGQEAYVFWPEDYDKVVALLNTSDRRIAAYELAGEGRKTQLVPVEAI